MNLTIENYHDQLVADSREVAAMLGRPHWALVRSVRTYCRYLNDNKIGVVEFFIPATYKDEKGEERPCYKLTEKGCDFVANKTTGEKGAVFTAQYVSAFHAMRDYLLELQSPVWQDTRSIGKQVRKEETAAIKSLVDYATAQGSQNAQRYYTSLSTLADRTAGITDRDSATVVQLTMLLTVERMIAREIERGIGAALPYKEIYRACKVRLSAVQNALSPCEGPVAV